MALCVVRTPPSSGLYILHEGPLGVFDETLNEQDYGDLRDAGGNGITVTPTTAGGWIGMTDKYWLAALLPSQTEKFSFSFKSLPGQSDRYQVDYIDQTGLILPAGGVVEVEGRLFAGAKKSRFLTNIRTNMAFPILIWRSTLAGSIS